LDEIGDIGSSLQAKLLQVLQDHEFSRLGGRKDVRVDVRVIAATNRNLEKAVEDGRFREDLYYRLNVVNITIPPLRDRKEEIPFFVEYFLNKFETKYQKKVRPFPDSLLKAFLQHDWLGNIRELENLIQRFVVLKNEDEILKELCSLAEENKLPEKKRTEEPIKGKNSLREVHKTAVRHAEKEAIHKALQKTNWNRKKAADLLNISYKSLLNKIKECEIAKGNSQLSS
jgi:two-component system response regulator AtoC